MTFKKPITVSRENWISGLATLSRLWKRGLYPEDLTRHYYLHWFVVYKGNIIQTAKALQIHRNTIQGNFFKLGYSKKSVRLRHTWQKLAEKNSMVPFVKNFYQYYLKFAKKPRLSTEENAGLVGLWQTMFPFKTLTPHYFLGHPGRQAKELGSKGTGILLPAPDEAFKPSRHAEFPGRLLALSLKALDEGSLFSALPYGVGPYEEALKTRDFFK